MGTVICGCATKNAVLEIPIKGGHIFIYFLPSVRVDSILLETFGLRYHRT